MKQITRHSKAKGIRHPYKDMKVSAANSRYLEVKGGDYERAFKQGEYFKGRRLEIIQAIKDVPLLPQWLQKKIPLSFYRAYLHFLGKKFYKRHLPLLKNSHGKKMFSQLEGLSEGLRENLFSLYGVNCFEIVSSQPPCTWGCSSLAFSSHQTQSGEPQIAYNHDFPMSFAPHLFIKKSEPEEGYSSLTLSYPPILGSIGGINEKGLAISLNHAFTISLSTHEALLITFLLQECLNSCSDVDSALALITETPVPNGSIMTLADAKGKRAAIELSCTKKRVRWAQNEKVLHSFNNFQHPEMLDVQIPLSARGSGPLKGIGLHEHNFSRHKRYEELVCHQKKYSDDEILKLLSDHNGKSGNCLTLCRHHVSSDTLCSAIFKPVSGQIRIVFGYPCQGTYTDYYLD